MLADGVLSAPTWNRKSVLSELTLMQIKGYVVQEPGKRFTLNIRRR